MSLDEEASARRREMQALHRQQLDADIRAVMETQAGRRVVWWLLDGVAGLHGPSFAGEATATAYNEGRRSVGIDVMQAVQRLTKPAYLLMVEERMRALSIESPDT